MVSLDSGSPRGSGLLRVLEDSDWDDLRRAMTFREFDPGACIVSLGEVQPAFHIISEGVASVSVVKPSGERLELTRLHRGDCIGDMSLLTGEPASADIHARTAVSTYSISQAALTAAGEQRSRLIESLSVLLAGRLRQANERLLAEHAAVVYGLDSAAVRVLGRLPLEMARASGDRVVVVAAFDDFEGIRRFAEASDHSVMLRVLASEEHSTVRAALNELSHQCDHVVLFAPPEVLRELAGEVDVALRVGTAAELANVPALECERLVVLADHPWTHAHVQRLSRALGRAVTAIIPIEAAGRGRHDPVAKLARVLTGRVVGVAFGAGAAKGFAHVGALRALEERGIPIDIVSGSSIGAAIAAGYALGLTVDEVSATVSRIAKKAMRLTIPVQSFFSSSGIREEFQVIGGNVRFEDLVLPLAIVATDIYRRCEVTFSSGLVWPSLLASMAIPGVYPPVRGRGSYLVDGGVLNPVPVKQARKLGAGNVVGIRLTGKRTAPRETVDQRASRPLASEIIMRSMEIMHNRISEVSNDQADVTIEVCLEGGGVSDFKRSQEYAAEGYRAALTAYQDIAAVVAPLS